jgi:hypothetical protein
MVGPPAWGFGVGLTTPYRKKLFCYENSQERTNMSTLTQFNSFLYEDPNVFLEYLALSTTLFMRAHWGYHGKEAMVIPFINFTAVHDLNKR